jgi:hypothetical protein
MSRYNSENEQGHAFEVLSNPGGLSGLGFGGRPVEGESNGDDRYPNKQYQRSQGTMRGSSHGGINVDGYTDSFNDEATRQGVNGWDADKFQEKLQRKEKKYQEQMQQNQEKYQEKLQQNQIKYEEKLQRKLQVLWGRGGTEGTRRYCG